MRKNEHARHISTKLTNNTSIVRVLMVNGNLGMYYTLYLPPCRDWSQPHWLFQRGGGQRGGQQEPQIRHRVPLWPAAHTWWVKWPMKSGNVPKPLTSIGLRRERKRTEMRNKDRNAHIIWKQMTEFTAEKTPVMCHAWIKCKEKQLKSCN